MGDDLIQEPLGAVADHKIGGFAHQRVTGTVDGGRCERGSSSQQGEPGERRNGQERVLCHGAQEVLDGVYPVGCLFGERAAQVFRAFCQSTLNYPRPSFPDLLQAARTRRIRQAISSTEPADTRTNCIACLTKPITPTPVELFQGCLARVGEAKGLLALEDQVAVLAQVHGMAS